MLTSSDPKHAGWPRWVKGLVSIVLVWHLVAMLSVALRGLPSSVLEQEAASVFAKYAGLIGQDSVHRYYAPAPPPTPIAIAEIEDRDGTSRKLRLPDRQTRPRLRYQRQLALAYHLFNDARRSAHWEGGGQGSALAASYARHWFAIDPNAMRIVIRVQEHLIPDLVRLRESGKAAHIKPDDERFYTVPEVVGEYERSDAE